MVNFAPKLRLLLLPLACLPWLVTAAQDDQPLPITLDADSSSFDRKTGRATFRGLRIMQGDVAIEAGEALASDLDFAQSEWRFSGEVRISIDSATIEADTAEIIFAAHELLTIELRGNPALFEDFSVTRDEALQGGANRLYFDNVDRTLQMSDGTWFNEGANEVRGCDLLYDFAQQRVTFGSLDCAERVQIIIVPPTEDTAGAATPLSQ
jgi:lipopolysaccharide transport protein LptA